MTKILAPLGVLLVATIALMVVLLVHEQRIPGDAERVLGPGAACGTATERAVTCVRGDVVFVCVQGEAEIRCAPMGHRTEPRR